MKNLKKSFIVPFIVSLVIVLIIIGLGGFYFEQSASVVMSTSVSQPPLNNPNFTITDLGKWIDARQQGTYYASNNSLVRDNSGNLSISYCSSGEPFNQDFAPDWRATANYSADKIRQQSFSGRNKIWSRNRVLVEAYREKQQDNLDQTPCTNSVIYYQGNYYIYFEARESDSGVIAIFVARSSNLSGPYEIFTYDGWKLSPTQSIYKPVLKPAILYVPGGTLWVSKYEQTNGQENSYWGAGIPRVTQKDNQLYLYYVDTTNFVIWSDSNGIHEYGRSPEEQIPYQVVSISNDPTSFQNNIENKLKTNEGQDMWNQFQVKYSLADNSFYGFYLDDSTGNNKLVYRKSANGTVWSTPTEIAGLPDLYKIPKGNNGFNGVLWTDTYIGVLGNKFGQLELSDIYLSLIKRYNLPNGPVGWPDMPNNKWYYGGTDIYGLKLSLLPSTLISTTTPTIPVITSPAQSVTVYPVCGAIKNSCLVGDLGENGTTGDGTNRWFWACVGQNTGWENDTAWCFVAK